MLKRIVSAFLAVASPARNQYISRNVKASAKAVHPIEVLDYRLRISQIGEAIRAMIVEPFPNKFLVFFTVNFDAPIL